MFGVWDLDLRLERVHYSPQWKARLGFPRIGAADSTAFWRCRVHPDDLEPMLQAFRNHLDGFSSTYEMQFRLRGNGSGYRTMRSRGRVIARDGSGNATRMVGTMVDLTGRAACAANYGLAAEWPETAERSPRLPFHAVLRAAGDRHGSQAEVVSENTLGRPQMADLVGDVLDTAWCDAKTADPARQTFALQRPPA